MTKNMMIILIAFILMTSGVILIAMDFFRLKQVYENSYKDSINFLKDSNIIDREPEPYTEEKLKSDLKMAEEFLRQNSYESIRKAMEIYNRIVSFAKEPKLMQASKYGLAYSLFRLNEESSALFHLKDLKKQIIYDPYLEEEVDYLIGKIQLFRGREDEGKAILNSLLSRTLSNDLKARIHATLGDYYQLKGSYKKARKSYSIALEYNPDSQFYKEIQKKIQKKQYYDPLDYESYDLDLYDSMDFTHEKKKRKNVKKSEKEQKIDEKKQEHKIQEEDKEIHKEDCKKKIDCKQPSDEIPKLVKSESFEDVKKLYWQGIVQYNKENYDEAFNLFIEVDKKISDLPPKVKKKIPDIELENILEDIYYYIGKINYYKQNVELARIYLEKVLENKNFVWDQSALIQLGIIQFDRSNYKQAYELFKRAIDNFPNGKYTNEAIKWLRETDKILNL